jgi:hypothetical protein
VVVGTAAAAAVARQVGQRVCLAGQLAHLSNRLFFLKQFYHARETSVVEFLAGQIRNNFSRSRSRSGSGPRADLFDVKLFIFYF